MCRLYHQADWPIFALIEPVITSLGEELDDIEDDVLDGSANALREKNVSIRKKAIIFKPHMVANVI